MNIFPKTMWKSANTAARKSLNSAQKNSFLKSEKKSHSSLPFEWVPRVLSKYYHAIHMTILFSQHIMGEYSP